MNANQMILDRQYKLADGKCVICHDIYNTTGVVIVYGIGNWLTTFQIRAKDQCEPIAFESFNGLCPACGKLLTVPKNKWEKQIVSFEEAVKLVKRELYNLGVVAMGKIAYCGCCGWGGHIPDYPPDTLVIRWHPAKYSGGRNESKRYLDSR